MTPFLLAQVIQLSCVYMPTEEENPSLKEILVDLSGRQGIVTSQYWSGSQYSPVTEQIDSLMVTNDYIVLPENNSTFVITKKTGLAGYTSPMSPNPKAFMYQCKLKK